MRQRMVGARGRLATVVVALVCALSSASGETRAQSAPEADSEPAAAPPSATEPAAETDLDATDDGALSSEELQALVAPIALYPDLVLVLALQASLAPLDIVQADRFLAQYAEDPSLVPDQGWDESVIGLLNYPTVVRTMSADLDWTDTLGTAVITQLEGVQDAIQDFRAFMRAIGALESNEQMTIIAEGDFIRIEPTDENAVFIPQYDPDALLAALYSTDVAPAPAETGAEAVAAPEAEAAEEHAEEVVTEDRGGGGGGAGRVRRAAHRSRAGGGAGLLPGGGATAGHLLGPRRRPGSAPLRPSPAAPWSAASSAGRSPTMTTTTIDDDDGDGDYSRGNIDIEDFEHHDQSRMAMATNWKTCSGRRRTSVRTGSGR